MSAVLRLVARIGACFRESTTAAVPQIQTRAEQSTITCAAVLSRASASASQISASAAVLSRILICASQMSASATVLSGVPTSAGQMSTSAAALSIRGNARLRDMTYRPSSLRPSAKPACIAVSTDTKGLW